MCGLPSVGYAAQKALEKKKYASGGGGYITILGQRIRKEGKGLFERRRRGRLAVANPQIAGLAFFSRKRIT